MSWDPAPPQNLTPAISSSAFEPIYEFASIYPEGWKAELRLCKEKRRLQRYTRRSSDSRNREYGKRY